MHTRTFSEAEVIELMHAARAGVAVSDLCREYGIDQQQLRAWRCSMAHMTEADAMRLSALEDENVRLRQLLAEALQRINPAAQTGATFTSRVARC